MLIWEVADPDANKLMSLVQFLSGRSQDTSAKKEISQDAFIQLAKNVGVNVTHDNLGDMIAKPPLSNILEPLEPNSNVIRFKGNPEAGQQDMSVDQAQEVVDKNAKAAMKRRT